MTAKEREAHDRARRTEAMQALFEEAVRIARECGAKDEIDGSPHLGIRARLAQVFMVAMVEVE
jgi:hypothetical protein